MDDKKQALLDLSNYIQDKFPDDIEAAELINGELVVVVNLPAIKKVAKFTRDDSNFMMKLCVDICGVDYPTREKRFDVVYNLLSMKHNLRIRLKVYTDEETQVPSLCEIWPTANWFEREAWDMYGIFFSNHPDLRRILTDYGFEGHPLRKDFPLTGFVEMRYDDNLRRCVYEPVKLTQDFRKFDFLSPWEGISSILPGDEKATYSNEGDE